MSKPRSYLASPEGLQRLQVTKAERNLSFAAIAEQAGELRLPKPNET